MKVWKIWVVLMFFVVMLIGSVVAAGDYMAQGVKKFDACERLWGSANEQVEAYYNAPSIASGVPHAQLAGQWATIYLACKEHQKNGHPEDALPGQ